MLALDLGTRRVGVAVSDPLRCSAQGLPTLARRGRRSDLAALARLITEHSAERVIVGLPVGLDGREGPAAAAARRFAAEIEAELGVPVDLWDERLTTAEAERLLVASGMRRRARVRHRDRMAAVLILQSWLDAQREDRR